MTGKWTQDGVPHKSWINEGVDDLEDDRRICEMCEVMEIRYVHYMTHPDYPEELRVGCVCAERMENDYVGPKQRERNLMNAAKRRKNWLQRQWRISEKGNEYLRTDGFVLIAFPKGDGYSGSLIRQHPERKAFLRYTHPTLDRAKLALLDGLLWVKEHWQDEPLRAAPWRGDDYHDRDYGDFYDRDSEAFTLEWSGKKETA